MIERNSTGQEVTKSFFSGEFRALELGKPYERYFRDIRLLQSYVQGRVDPPPKNKKIKNALAELETLVALLSIKPNLSLLGEFDSGKSTLANVLMEAESLPAKIAPHTAIPTIVRHLEDRAKWMEDEVYLLDALLPKICWDDRGAIEEHLIAKGPIELLHQSTHKQASRSARAKRAPFTSAQMALVYIASPILHACNLLDFPGYGHDEHDEEKAQRFENLSDAAVYLSPINGFLKSQDILRIGQALSKIGDLEPIGGRDFPLLGNLFIVASHADPRRFDSDDIETVFESASIRIMRQLGEFAIEEKSARVGRKIGKKHLTERLFLFWKDRDVTYLTLDKHLFRLLAVQLPEAWAKRAQVELRRFKENSVEMVGGIISTYEERLKNLRGIEKAYLKYKEEESTRKHLMQQKIASVVAQIKQFSKQSRNEFSSELRELVRPEKLEHLIRAKFQKKKEAEEYALGYVYELSNKTLKEILAPKTQRISTATEVFVQEYHDQKLLGAAAINVGFTPDDMRTFLVGATTTGSLGALASLGLVYGGSWLAVHTTGLLAAVGAGAASLGTAVTAGIVTAMSALTGPIGIAIVAGLALFALFRAPWEERLANEIAKRFSENQVLEKFLVAIDRYWKETETAFLGGVSELDKRWEESLEELRAQITHPEQGEQKIAATLKEMNLARNFFLGIPCDDRSE